MKITALIPTFNCEKSIINTLDSISWVDEILIIDSFSTDSTLELIKPYNVTIYQHPYVNSANQKNWALQYCNYDWVFQIDSDEILEKNAQRVILETIKNSNENVHCFKMPRQNYVLGKWIKNGGLYPDWQYRLFKPKYAKWENKDVHSKIRVSGKVQIINIKLIHHGMPNISKQLTNLNRYTKYEVDYKKKIGEEFSFLRMIFGPFLVFIYRYIFLKGILDGWRGFFLAIYTAIYYFLIQSKLYEVKLLKLEKSP